ncbi:Protein of unknown function [Gryllus bimaculatus]|nr:Protein of unknown function [Gryllus bimaculatus]
MWLRPGVCAELRLQGMGWTKRRCSELAAAWFAPRTQHGHLCRVVTATMCKASTGPTLPEQSTLAIEPSVQHVQCE